MPARFFNELIKSKFLGRNVMNEGHDMHIIHYIAAKPRVHSLQAVVHGTEQMAL